jgi:trimethylamine:corrinoid methyltransferase-like protein
VWRGKGGLSIEEDARRRALELLATHTPPALPSSVEAEIERILHKAIG